MASAATSECRPSIPLGARVVVMQGFYEGLELPIDATRRVIGRGAGADWCLSELTISRSHAAFGWDGDAFFVEDLGSTNGTLVNGERHARASLRDGDEVQIGRLRLRVALPARALDGSPG